MQIEKKVLILNLNGGITNKNNSQQNHKIYTLIYFCNINNIFFNLFLHVTVYYNTDLIRGFRIIKN